jgi:hypothetical protein
MEKKISNYADTNDCFNSPIILGTGEVEGFAENTPYKSYLIHHNRNYDKKRN